MTVSSAACERARACVSRRLDGELNELSRRALERHLARCAECSRYAADVVWFTDLLREAPLERYHHDVYARRGRHPSRLRRVAPSIAALLLAGLVSATALSQQLGGKPDVSTGDSTSSTVVTIPSPPVGPARLGGESIKLPIGQRLAADDF